MPPPSFLLIFFLLQKKIKCGRVCFVQVAGRKGGSAEEEYTNNNMKKVVGLDLDLEGPYGSKYPYMGLSNRNMPLPCLFYPSFRCSHLFTFYLSPSRSNRQGITCLLSEYSVPFLLWSCEVVLRTAAFFNQAPYPPFVSPLSLSPFPPFSSF